MPAGYPPGYPPGWPPASTPRRAPVVVGIIVTVVVLGLLGLLAVRVALRNPGTSTGSSSSSPAGVRSTSGSSCAGDGSGGKGTVPNTYAGNWIGTLGATVLSIELVSGCATGSIEYTGLGCSGSLTVTEVASSYLELKESTRGSTTNCPQGFLTLVPKGDGSGTSSSLSVRWEKAFDRSTVVTGTVVSR